MEDNVLIAEFMGGKYVDEDLIELKDFIALKVITIDQSGEPLKVVSTECFTENELSYHSSWDWLMPVVEKIFSLGYDYTIKPRHMIIKERMGEIVSECIGQYQSQEEVIYQAVVEFINEHNKTI